MTREKGYTRVRIGLLGCLMFFYLQEQWRIMPTIGHAVIDRWLVEGIWIGVLISMMCLPKVHMQGRMKHRGSCYIVAFNIAVAYIVINLMLGIWQGFGKSPYDHTFKGIVMNMSTLMIPLIGREWIRHYLINAGTKAYWKATLPIVIVGMTVISIRINQWESIKNLQSLTVFAANTLLPRLSEETLVSYLVLYAGPWASIIYLGIVESFEWLSPILPDLSWLIKGVVGMIVPLVGVMILNQQYEHWMGYTKRREQEAFNLYEYLAAATLSVGLIWFVVGVFPIYPSAIATGSMQPVIDPGDVVFVKKIQDQTDIYQLKVGDIIQFRREDILINHRIIKIDKNVKGTIYQTKGDNNTTPDTDWVKPEDIKGTIVKVIPKIGWPTLMLKNSQKVPPIAVEF